MAGKGFAPKPPEKRVGHSKDPHGMKVVHAEPTKQPPLPKTLPEGDPWPPQTQSWWAMWGASPLTAEFIDNDWAELLDTALIHARLWQGDTKVAAELRLRTAKHGATAEDRARLRIQFATADEAEEKREKATRSARDRRGPLEAV